MNELADAIEAVLRSCGDRLAASTLETVRRTPATVRSLLAVGEDALAYEALCDNVFEDAVPVPRPLLLDLRAAAVRAGADPDRTDCLLG